MKRCIVLGYLSAIQNEFNLLNSYHVKNDIEIVGLSCLYESLDNMYGFKNYQFENLNEVEYDYIIVISSNENFKQYIDFVKELYPDAKIINSKVFKLPFFDIDKYLEIYSNPPTIFSESCSAGILYNSLGLEFKSPTINLWMSDDDYFNFLSNPKKYFDAEITQIDVGKDYEEREYPICKCDDIKLHFTHYKSAEEGIKAWKERSKRVDFDNIMLVYLAYDEKYIKKFIKLPYKKICICSFDYDDPCVFKLDLNEPDFLRWKFITLEAFKNNIPRVDVLELVYSATLKKYYEEK